MPTAAFGSAFNDDRFVTSDWRGFVDAALDRAWRGTRTRFVPTSTRTVTTGRIPGSATAGAPNVLATDYGHGTWWGAEGARRASCPGRQTLTAGLEFRDYAHQAQGEAFEEDPDANWAVDLSTHVFAAYAQDEIRLRDKFLLTVGGRYDTYSGFNRFSPRVGVVYMAKPTRAIKYLFGTAFRAPSAFEFDYLTQGVRNTDLRAETITTNEFVWEEYTGDWLRTTVAAYRNDVSRLIELTANEFDELSFANQGRVLARGLEFEAEVRSAGVQYMGSYALQRTRERDTGQELTNSPRHLGKFRLAFDGPVVGSTFGAELQTISQRLTVARTCVEGHAVGNVHYVHPINERLALTATMRNVFDSHYGDPASPDHRQTVVPQDGRTVYIGLRWNWTP